MVLNGNSGTKPLFKYSDFIRGEVRRLSAPLTADFEFMLTGFAAVNVRGRRRRRRAILIDLSSSNLQQEVNDAIASDTSMLDSIVLPIAFVIMAIYVRSLRLLIVPAFSISITILGAFAVIDGLTFAMDVPSFVPSFVLSMLLGAHFRLRLVSAFSHYCWVYPPALSIDYAIFMLTRYRYAILCNFRQILSPRN